MAKLVVKLNYANGGKLLKSEGLASALASLAEPMAHRAGEGYASDTYMAGSRVIASAYTATRDAMIDQANNNTLQKAML